MEEDLFAAEDERSVLICDVKLLSELASRKLQGARRKLGDGWRWIDTILEAPWDVTRQFGRVKGKPEPPTDAENARLTELTAEIDRLKQAAYALGDAPDNAAERDRLAAEIEKLETDAQTLDEVMHSRESYSAELMACSGCIVTIGGEGDLVIHKGLVRRQDEHLVPAPPTPGPAASTPGPTAEAAAPTDGTRRRRQQRGRRRGGPGSGGTPRIRRRKHARCDEPEHPEPAPSRGGAPAPAPDAGYRPPQYDHTEPDERAAATQDAGLRLGLADDLRLIRTGIIKAYLECDPELAFDLAAYQMISAVFGGTPDGPLAIEITATRDLPEGVDPDDREGRRAAEPRGANAGRGGHLPEARLAAGPDPAGAAAPVPRAQAQGAAQAVRGRRRPGAHAAARLRPRRAAGHRGRRRGARHPVPRAVPPRPRALLAPHGTPGDAPGRQRDAG